MNNLDNKTLTPQGQTREETGKVSVHVSKMEQLHEHARRLAIEIEDEWQTSQDHIEFKRLSDSIFYLNRLQTKANELCGVLSEIKALYGDEAWLDQRHLHR